MTENEIMLYDRIEMIKITNQKYDLEHNAYLSFSGGKDSTLLHYLLDMALPNNRIPRVYINTGIEYIDIVKFVRELASKDDRIIIVNSGVPIRPMLEKYGYPFKSKEHSSRVEQFNNNNNKNFILKYTRQTDYNGKYVCPKTLMYQFVSRGGYNYSNKCCYKLKKDVAHKWQKGNKKSIFLTGMRKEEGGNREHLTCAILKDGKLKKFHPLIPVSEEWEEWFLKTYNIKLCKLYYPPYNFVRTGCKGCPFSLTLQESLLTMKRLLPIEYRQCLSLWKPVYDEYVRLGYRLDKDFYSKASQYTIDDYLDKGE